MLLLVMVGILRRLRLWVLVMGFVHEYPEPITKVDRLPSEVSLSEKHADESAAMRYICGRSRELEGLFDIWEDFDLKNNDVGRNSYWVDKSIVSPAVVAYVNSMDSIVSFYRESPVEFEKLLGSKKYKGIARGEIFDVMEASLAESHNYSKNVVKVGPIFVDAIDAVLEMKTKDVSKIFDVFYRSLAGGAWGKVCGRDFYMDRVATGKVGLERMRVGRGEVLGLIGSV